MLDLVFENKTDNRKFGQDFFEKIFEICVSELKIKEPTVELSLRLVDRDEIRFLNKTYRRKDEVTDVLSFPLNEELARKYGILSLGDMVICPDEAPSHEEMTRAVAHGFLHLLGYDHERSASDSKKMFALQEKIVKLNI